MREKTYFMLIRRKIKKYERKKPVTPDMYVSVTPLNRDSPLVRHTRIAASGPIMIGETRLKIRIAIPASAAIRPSPEIITDTFILPSSFYK